MENSLSILPALLSVDPLQTISVDRLLYDDPSSPPDSLMLPQGEPLIRLLLLFAQLLVAVASERRTIFAPVMEIDTTMNEVRRVVISAVTSKLEQLTDISCCTPVLLTDPIPGDETSDAPQLMPTPSKHVIMLRSLVLFLKLATLASSIKPDLHGHVAMPLLVQSLWDIILYLLGSFSDDNLAVTEEDGSCSLNIFASQQEHTLCVVLCEHAVAMLRQAVKQPKAELPRKGCLRLLAIFTSLMPAELLRHEVKKLGKP